MPSESIKPDLIRRLADMRPRLVLREATLQSVRGFFSRQGFLEIETPIAFDSPLPEPHIEAVGADRGCLRTSHEPALKACLAAGYERVYEIGPCFRKEERGRLHLEEFTMLEWYQTGCAASDLIPFARNLLANVAMDVTGKSSLTRHGKPIRLDGDWEMISLVDAFAKFAGCDIADAVSSGRFELLLVEKIEPKLPQDRPCVVMDYPEEFRAYAKLCADKPHCADRWELYIAGIELANACAELTNPMELKILMDDYAKKRALLGMKAYDKNRFFDAAIAAGIPASAGCAMGIDRLVMLISGADSIDDVRL